MALTGCRRRLTLTEFEAVLADPASAKDILREPASDKDILREPASVVILQPKTAPVKTPLNSDDDETDFDADFFAAMASMDAAVDYDDKPRFFGEK